MESQHLVGIEDTLLDGVVGGTLEVSVGPIYVCE